MNFLTLQVKTPTRLHHGDVQVSLAETWAPVLQPYQGQSITLGIRPEHLNLATADPHHLPVQVELVEALGHETYLSLTLVSKQGVEVPAPPALINARIAPHHQVQVGERLWLSIQTDNVHLFDPDTGMTLAPKDT